MRHDLAELRRRVRALGSRHRGARVPRALRAAITAYAMAERSAGTSCGVIAKRLGVSAESIRRWAQRRPQVGDGRGRGFVPVRVVADVVGRTLTVLAPTGYRVEGLSIAEVAELLRRLG